jgi:ADP-dependent NAD(P)H-hydrate dehydratase / NAD(P)H-hydrate epimerase
MAHEYLNQLLTAPAAEDNKYSRGVVGFITGSREYPGSALLGVSGAVRTGVGLVRYLGPNEPANLVLLGRPECVIQPGPADAWVVGSGMPADDFTPTVLQNIYDFGLVVIDAAALTRVDYSKLTGRAILTPHTGELARLLRHLGQSAPSIATLSTLQAALLAAQLTNQLVILKGHQTIIAMPNAEPRVLPPASSWLATAGTGDVLAGIIGGLLAIHSSSILAGRLSLDEIAELGVRVHSLAAEIAMQAGPPAALDVAEAVRVAVRQLAV